MFIKLIRIKIKLIYLKDRLSQNYNLNLIIIPINDIVRKTVLENKVFSITVLKNQFVGTTNKAHLNAMTLVFAVHTHIYLYTIHTCIYFAITHINL